MIHKRSYTPEWVDAKVKELDANSFDLAEKMTWAFTLLEQLQLKGLRFVFKGGTSLVLMIDEFHRFSKDIDIIMPEEPADLQQIFESIVNDTDFIRYEESIRQNDEFQVPKKHYKFFYKESKPSKFPEKPILLDIIFVESTYPRTRMVKIDHPLLSTEQPYAEIEIPTIDSITGDKLTAFATGTIGIPAGKNKSIEIVKQLFDLNLLYHKIESFPDVAESFERTAAMCLRSYQKNHSITEIYEDIINTSFTMAMMGLHNKPLFDEIKKGVSGLTDYLSRKARFGYPSAILAAAKVAYLAACLMKKEAPQDLDWKSIPTQEFKDKKIEHPVYAALNRSFKPGNPEAWFFWYHTALILSIEKEELIIEETKIAPAIIASTPAFDHAPKELDLVFIVNGKETLVDDIDQHEFLRVAVQQALDRTGNSGRPLDHWVVKFNAMDLNISAKIIDLNLPEDAKIFVSLKAGAGG